MSGVRVALVSRAPAPRLRTAATWVEAGEEVLVVLVDAAAAAARRGHADARALADAVASGVRVAVHDEALARYGIPAPAPGVEAVTLDRVAELVADEADAAVWL